ncbi:unnamed protein product, partial [Schistosoma curassoni]|uniref:Cadherin domain-containing protein n=1 Tax=Schistosoma curassoni TaxID=6186 RepID=A0A183KMZ9_9TREM
IILTVEANDGGSLPRSTTCIVEITVLDENDHSPELHFEPAHLTNYALVPENEKPGRLVAVFTAQDKDSGDNGRVSCRLAETRKWTFDTQNKEKLESLLLNPTEILFSLQQMHMPFSIIYKLTTASSFDREFISKITVWITCSDYGIPPRNSTGSVAVRISDVNDEPPIFSQTHYYFNINENTEIGTIINKINATDPDEGENAKLTFWLSGQNANYFDVNKATGYLTVQKLLDREMINELRFQIHAADNGMPSLNSSADITIIIQDVNDNPPSILNKIEFYILENHTASLAIGKITAYDADIGRNAEITFTLIQCIAYGLNTFNSSDSIVHESYENYLSNKKNFSQSLEIMYTLSQLHKQMYLQLELLKSDKFVDLTKASINLGIHPRQPLYKIKNIVLRLTPKHRHANTFQNKHLLRFVYFKYNSIRGLVELKKHRILLLFINWIQPKYTFHKPFPANYG